jgi:predicted enzyme related to lactoylglutathione lyase
MRPVQTPDEDFHRAITGFLGEWGSRRGGGFEAVWVVGERWSARSQELRDTFSRNGIPIGFYDASSERGHQILGELGLASLWCGLLGVEVETTIGDGQFVVLSAAGNGLTVGFQRVDEGKAGKNRLHLDLFVEDLDAATAEVESPGGRWLEPGMIRELEGFRWRIMADPEGNEFDIDVLPSG